jgi:hypothetical protein
MEASFAISTFRAAQRRSRSRGQTALPVTVDTMLWAAWTGLGLAVISAAALVPFMPEAPHRAAGAHGVGE